MTVLLAQLKGILTVVSAKNFHSQRYHIIKHPGLFFKKRPNLKERIENDHCKLQVDKDFEKDPLDDKDHVLLIKDSFTGAGYDIFKSMQLQEKLAKGVRFRVPVQYLEK